MARVVLGVTGGIAAYKAAELTRLLVGAGHEVTPILTAEAEGFVAPKTFEALARREAARDLYPHLVKADLLVIAPLSANTLAKLAQGLADNVLTQTALAFEGPILVAPAMNARKWAHEATQANAATLRARGIVFVGPDEGELAEGEWGVGRMSVPDEIFRRIEGILTRREQLAGKRVLVSAGGTREPLDSVRFLGNRSSGRMGVALAEEARLRGADVTLVAANLAVPPPGKVEVVPAATAAALEREVLARADADVVVMAAAVADYRPAEATTVKRPKGREPWTVTLEPTTDILEELGSNRHRGQVLIGFAADHGPDGLARAHEKLAAKRSDLIVYNDVSRSDIGFDASENEVVLVSATETRRIGKTSKAAIAAEIMDEVVKLVRSRNGGRPAA